MIQDFPVLTERPIYDRKTVSQSGYVDLTQAFESMSIPADLSSVEGKFDGIMDPAAIIGKPDDVFALKRAVAAYKDSAAAAGGMPGQPEGPEGGE